jgi:2-oxoglutarate dehydrogenase E2 component (dihydrolipoamide succinyltransferase)
LPAEASGIITLKAEEGDAVAVGAVVCHIDTDEKPSGDAPVAEATKLLIQTSGPKLKLKADRNQGPNQLSSSSSAATYASGTPSPAARKILDEKI